jgi:hypothetical protein
MVMAGGKVRLPQTFSPRTFDEVWNLGINSKGQKGIFPSNYVCLPRVILFTLLTLSQVEVV